ncbi:hypothetical protein ACIGC1_03055 [Peribacillus butanolivorans]
MTIILLLIISFTASFIGTWINWYAFTSFDLTVALIMNFIS